LDELLQGFRLGRRVDCNAAGLFVGTTPLLEEVAGTWRPRSQSELNHDLSRVYGLQIDVSRKLGGLSTVARALNDDDLAKAQIAALHLRLPGPPDLATSAQAQPVEFAALVRKLVESDLLEGWDPDLHPRWPAGSQDSVGGQFAPQDGGGAAASEGSADGPAMAQVDIPFEEPFPLYRPIPAPQVVPRPPGPIPPLIGPIPRNPSPDRPECVKEWEDAWRFCKHLEDEGELGRPDSWFGRTVEECMRGQVSEDCGGNPVV
jgi:hypothetical protein